MSASHAAETVETVVAAGSVVVAGPVAADGTAAESGVAGLVVAAGNIVGAGSAETVVAAETAVAGYVVALAPVVVPLSGVALAVDTVVDTGHADVWVLQGSADYHSRQGVIGSWRA